MIVFQLQSIGPQDTEVCDLGHTKIFARASDLFAMSDARWSCLSIQCTPGIGVMS